MLKLQPAKSNHLSVNTNQEGSYSTETNDFLSVNSIWICRQQYIIAESQIGSKSINKKQKKFVKVFVEQIIQPSKHSNSTKKLCRSPSFSVYVKKRKYLFHVLLDNDLTFLSLTTNTLQQQPTQEIFDLLYEVKSAFLYEDNLTFNDTLTDLHHSYQFKSKSKIIYFKDTAATNNTNNTNNTRNVNKSLLSHSDGTHNLEFCDSDGFDALTYSPSPVAKHIQYNNTHSKPSNDTLNLSMANLVASSPSKSHNNDSSASPPSFSNNSCPFSDTPTDTNTSKSNTETHSRTHTNTRTPTSNTTFKINYEHESQQHDEDICEELEYFILKKGWMSKMGERFKTWKFRYFELWSNGLLNYFDNEMKIKKKGSLNIVDEVVNVQLYAKNSNNNSNVYGFMLCTHERQWCFVVNKENVRNDWYLLIQTITFNKKVDLNLKFKTLKLRLEKLDFKWETKFKSVEFEIFNGNGYEYNLYQLQYQLTAAANICQKCKKEIVYFCGSDIFAVFTSKIDYISTNIEGTLATIDTIIHSRNETPFRKRKRNKNKWYNKRNRQNKKKNQNNYNYNGSTLKQNTSNTSSNSNSSNSSSSSTFDASQIVIEGAIKVRLPSKKMIRAKNALSKKIKLLNVMVHEKYFKIDVDRENTAPLIWKFDDMTCINDIKGVYYGRKKTEKVNISDIQQFQITIFHSSLRRVQFVFQNEKEAYLWYSTIKSLYDKANAVHVPLCYDPNQ